MATISYLPPGLEAHVARATDRINRERALKRFVVVASLVGGAIALVVATCASFNATSSAGIDCSGASTTPRGANAR